MTKTMFGIHKVITNNICLNFFHEKKAYKGKKKFLSFIIKSKQHVHCNLGQLNTNYIIFRNFGTKITSFFLLKDNEKSDEIFENISFV
jgi:hypothetical protein